MKRCLLDALGEGWLNFYVFLSGLTGIDTIFVRDFFFFFSRVSPGLFLFLILLYIDLFFGVKLDTIGLKQLLEFLDLLSILSSISINFSYFFDFFIDFFKLSLTFYRNSLNSFCASRLLNVIFNFDIKAFMLLNVSALIPQLGSINSCL